MKMDQHNFEMIDWNNMPEERLQGVTGYALSQTTHLGEIRIRKVVYSPGFTLDHWCIKGHIIHCIEGDLKIQLENNRSIDIQSGASCMVGDFTDAHTFSTQNGCTLFIVD